MSRANNPEISAASLNFAGATNLTASTSFPMVSNLEENSPTDRVTEQGISVMHAETLNLGTSYGDPPRVQFLEDQLRRNSTLYPECPPPQTTHTTLPTAGHVNRLSFGASAYRRLTRDQVASRNSLAKELPKYDGKPSEWPLFFAAYNQTTDVCGFSDEENLLRLRQALEGPARKAVKNLLLHSPCVNQIIATLQMRFGRPELIISVLQRQIYDLPPPSENHLESIVDFAVEVQNICATMSVSGLTSHLNNPEFEQRLVSKLPGLLPAYWGMHKRTLTACNLQNFSDWLFQLAQGANSVIIPKESVRERKRGSINHHSNSVRCIVCNESCSEVSNCTSFKEMPRSQRWQLVRKLKLCQRCLRKHPNHKCNSDKPCNVNGCNRNHHLLLHNSYVEHTVAEKTSKNVNIVSRAHSANVNAHVTTATSTMFRIFPVVLHSGHCRVSTYAFIDDGSSLTLIDEELLKQLKVKGTPQPLCLRWTGDTHRYENESVVADLIISASYGQKKFALRGVRSVKRLHLPTQSLNAEKLQSKFKYLKGLPLQSYSNASPRLLISLNNAALGSPIKSLYGEENEPIAEKSRLGWTLKGLSPDPNVDAIHHVYHICDCSAQAELLEITKSYICLDNLGVSTKPVVLMSKEDEAA